MGLAVFDVVVETRTHASEFCGTPHYVYLHHFEHPTTPRKKIGELAGMHFGSLHPISERVVPVGHRIYPRNPGGFGTSPPTPAGENATLEMPEPANGYLSSTCSNQEGPVGAGFTRDCINFNDGGRSTVVAGSEVQAILDLHKSFVFETQLICLYIKIFSEDSDSSLKNTDD